jgi:uncharacterized OB-fold protein
VPAWFDDFAAGVAAGDPQYLVCSTCQRGMLPPRRLCPACGETDLRRESLPRRGTVDSYTEITVTTPKFHGETPYTVVLVDLTEPITLTAQLRGASPAEVAIGDPVVLGAEPRDEGTAVLTVRPVDG